MPLASEGPRNARQHVRYGIRADEVVVVVVESVADRVVN